MAEAPRSRNGYRWPLILSGIAAIASIAQSMGGHRLPHPWSYQPGGPWIPMAPQSALLSALLALALLCLGLERKNPVFPRLARALAAPAFLLDALALLGMVLGAHSLPGRWIQQHLLDFARMSPLTVAAMTGVALGLLPFLLPAPSPWGRRQMGALAGLLPLGIGTVVLLSYLADAPLLYGAIQVPMPLGGAAVALLLGLGLLAHSGTDTWPSALFVHLDPLPGPQGGPSLLHRVLNRFWRSPLLVFAVLALLVLGSGSLYRRFQLRHARRTAHTELALIADQKSEALARWHRDQEDMARSLCHGSLLQEQFRRFLEDASTPSLAPQLQDYLEDLRKLGFAHATLYDARGRGRMASKGSPFLEPGHPGLGAALSTLEVLEQDFRADGPEGPYHLDFWVPIGPPLLGRNRGTLRLQVDPATFLFPALRSWPGLSRSAELLLLRVEGAQVACFHPMRSGTTHPLESRTPLAGPSRVISAIAVRQGNGFSLGLDHRGTPVIAAFRQVPGTPWWLVAKEDQEEVFAPLRLRNALTMTMLMAMVLVLALVIGVLLRNQDNRRILAVLQQERERKTLAERFQQIMRQANDIILLLAQDGRVVEANPRAEEAYGYPLAELERMRIGDLRAPEARPLVEADLHQAFHGELKRLETWHLRRDGTRFPVEVSARAVSFAGETYVLSFIRDVTERHHQNQALQRLSRLYAALSQVNQAIVWSEGQAALFGKTCQVLVEFGGFQLAWIGEHDFQNRRVIPLAQFGTGAEHIPELDVRTDDSPLGHGPVGTVLRENRPCLLPHVLEDERILPWRRLALEIGCQSVGAFPIRLDGQPLYALAVYAQDGDFFGPGESALLEEAALDLSLAISHLAQEARRRKAEEALRRSEAQLTALTACAPDLILTMDAQGRILYSNRPLGQPGDTPFLGRNWEDWLLPEHRDTAREALAAALLSGQRQELEAPGNLSHAEPRWHSIRISPILGTRGGGAAAVVFATDIEDARKAQAEQADLAAQLAQSQKLESLGSLAGGVAHDMNNVLGAILSLASAHREKVGEGDPFAGSLDTIISACMRGRGVVKSLLYFAHKDLEQVTAIDLNVLVNEMVQLLAYTTLKRIHLNMDLQEGLGTLQGDSGALSHTLMNLCVNAMDAMPGGGSLTIRTLRLGDGRLQLSVEDTGCGMTPEVREKALEPFFTTKPQGKGTGLGLAMAYATMQAHEGTLELRSVPGQGTQVILTFPASRIAGQAPETRSPEGPEAAPGGPWNLLLVDDDDLIRLSVAPMLECLGHRVHTASGGQEALTLLEQGLEVDLVILDMNMPGLNGAATLPRILDLRPNQRVLMATGYSDEDIAGLLEGHTNLFSIHKPFSLSEIRIKFAAIFG